MSAKSPNVPSLPAALAVLLLAGAAWLGLRSSQGPEPPPPDAPPTEGSPSTEAPGSGQATGGRSPAATVSAASFCLNVGYLCAGLASSPEIRLQRWRDFVGTMVVHVPIPELGDVAAARELQAAAMAGIRAWNNQPFPILAETTGRRPAHFAVRWSRSLGGTQLGVARTRWSTADGLDVLEIELALHDPFDAGRLNEPRQVRLTAAHEMGHALGLGHSDQSRDVMFPTNTATSMSANDYRSVEALYAEADGTTIVR